MNIALSLALLVAGILVFGAALVVPAGEQRFQYAVGGGRSGTMRAKGSASSAAANDRGDGQRAEIPPAAFTSVADRSRSDADARSRPRHDRDGEAASLPFDDDRSSAIAAGVRRAGIPGADALADADGTQFGFAGAADAAFVSLLGRTDPEEADAEDDDGTPEAVHLAESGGVVGDGYRSAVMGGAASNGEQRAIPSAVVPEQEAVGGRALLTHEEAASTFEGVAETVRRGEAGVGSSAPVGPSRQRLTAERCLVLLNESDLALALDAAYELRLRLGGTVLDEILALAVPARRAAAIRATLPPESPIASYS